MAAREEPGPDLVLGRPQVGKNLLSDTLALTAAGHLARNLARAVEDGSDLEARTGMLYGSLLAGIAFGNSGVSAAHALQFAVGAATHTSHGLGTGLLLPYCMEFNRPAREAELAELERIFGAEPVAFVHELGRRIGLPASLAEIGVAREDLRGDGGGVGRHQAPDRQQPAPARRGRRSSASSRPRGRAGSDLEARTGMLYGSLLAGIAFGNSGVSAAHALQFAVGAATHTSHGLGTGLLLPYCMEFNRPAREPELAELQRIFGAEPVAFIHELGRRIGLPASLAEIGVAREDLRGMAEASVSIKRLIDNNPRPLDADGLERILEAAWHGEPSRLSGLTSLQR